jgi:hypothetical protein
MSDLTPFLSNVLSQGWLRDSQHASKLYRSDGFYDYAPKNGWIYYVTLNINPAIQKYLNKQNPIWTQKYSMNVGLLAKNVELPKFTIETEILNQYNRKTIVQKKLDYTPVNISFHDDQANISTDLWTSYYSYYFGDGRYSNTLKANNSTVEAWTDTKYKNKFYHYGLNNEQNYKFFNSITVYLLNKQKFLSLTLVNPIIKEWRHGEVDQTQGNKFLENKMVLTYENVLYNRGDAGVIGFNNNHYDKTPSPLSIAGGGSKSLFGPGGVVAGASSIFGANGSIVNASSPQDYLNVAIQTANLAKNASSLNKTASVNELTGVALGQVQNAAQGGSTVFNSGAVNGVQLFTPNIQTGPVAQQVSVIKK